jgi:uncharacterized protein YgiM (DUF1202 family)
MSLRRLAILLAAISLAVGACASPASSEPDISALVATSVKATIDAGASHTPIVLGPTASQTPHRINTVTPTATQAPTQTLLPPKVSVSLATNCRTGPGLGYPQLASLKPGQVADVVGRSGDEDYWYIALPDQSVETCWIWGEYASVEGSVASVPVLTPEPSPVPQVVFTLYRHSFTECGTVRVSLVVVNTGYSTFRSARVQIRDVTADNNIYGPNTDSHPFGDNPSSCPKDKGSESLSPGATAYLVIPMKDFKAGNEAAAYVTLCTQDDAQGNCVTRGAYFRLPAD